MGVNIILDEDIKYLVKTAHQIYQNDLTPGKSGNISVKKEGEKESYILITPSGVSLRDVTLENVIITDLDGNKLKGKGVASSELYMHLKIYQSREDVRAIVHTHSPYATGFSFTDKKIPRLEGFGKITNPYLKVVDYATPGSTELVELAANGLLKEDVIILKNHGVVAVGPSLDESALLAEFTESSAKTGFIIHFLRDRR